MAPRSRSARNTRGRPQSSPQTFTCRLIRPLVAPAPGMGPGGWGRLDLSFAIGRAPAGIGVELFRASVRAAFDAWGAVVPFVFSEAAVRPDLSVAAVPPSHGDPFDFPPVTTDLAHAFGPITGGGELDGQVHLNDAKTWADGSTADADVVTVVLHELGHALGIAGHLDGNPDNVMNGNFSPGLIRRALTADDIQAIRAAYANVF
jgi:predicted Zn-dependent protease